MAAHSVERFGKRDEVARNEPRALMNQLIERMLSVGSWFAPVNRTGVVFYFFPLQRDMLAVALHSQLLQVCGETFEILFVRQNSNRRGAEEVVIPYSQQAHESRKIACKRRGTEVLIYLVKATEHSAEIIRADSEHG